MRFRHSYYCYATLACACTLIGCHSSESPEEVPEKLQLWRDSATLWQERLENRTYQFQFGECVYYGSISSSDVCSGGYGYRQTTTGLVVDGVPYLTFEARAPEGPFAQPPQVSLLTPISIEHYFAAGENYLDHSYIEVNYDQNDLPRLEWDYENGHSFNDSEVKLDLISVTFQEEFIESLNSNRMKWENNAQQNYVYSLIVICDCDLSGTLEVTIENGSLQHVYSTDQGAEISVENLEIPFTINGLFDLISAQFHNENAIVDVTYHEWNGFPEKLSIFEKQTNDTNSIIANYLSISIEDLVLK